MMSVFFPWTDKMSVQSQEIDDQHKQLVGFLNELYDAFMEKKHKEHVGTIIKKMADYTQYHFATEEKYFEKFGYVDRAKHVFEHEGFKQKVSEFIAKYEQNHGALSYEVINYLRNWLQKHIMETDMKYVECFQSNGIS